MSNLKMIVDKHLEDGDITDDLMLLSDDDITDMVFDLHVAYIQILKKISSISVKKENVESGILASTLGRISAAQSELFAIFSAYGSPVNVGLDMQEGLYKVVHKYVVAMTDICKENKGPLQ